MVLELAIHPAAIIGAAAHARPRPPAKAAPAARRRPVRGDVGPDLQAALSIHRAQVAGLQPAFSVNRRATCQRARAQAVKTARRCDARTVPDTGPGTALPANVRAARSGT